MCDIEGILVAAVSAMEFPERVDVDKVVELLEEAVSGIVAKQVDELEFSSEIGDALSSMDLGECNDFVNMVDEAVKNHVGEVDDIEDLVEKAVQTEVEETFSRMEFVDKDDFDAAVEQLNELKNRGFFGRLRWLLTGR